MIEIKLGMTGTRFGMIVKQEAGFVAAIMRIKNKHRKIVEWHHGDCVGADEQSHYLIRAIDKNIAIHIHPPVDTDLQAKMPADVYYDPKTHFARNRDIVDATDMLIATPYTQRRESKGGTWYTINYALKMGKPALIIWPDGRYEDA
jgi:hypothetical protein